MKCRERTCFACLWRTSHHLCWREGTASNGIFDRHIHVRLDGMRPPRKTPAAPHMGVPVAVAMLTKFVFSCGPQTEEHPKHFLIRNSIDEDLFSQVLSRGEI